jgi:ABC-2 type transport system permease protein
MNILRTEWLKIRSYWAFWLMMLMISLAYPGVNYLFYNQYRELSAKKDLTGQMMKMLLGNPFELPETYHTTAFFSSVFLFIPAILVIMLVTNEYTYKTSRQNIIDGWSRDQFLLGKFFDVFIISALVTLIFAIFSTVVGLVATTGTVADRWSGTRYIAYFGLQTFSQLSIAFLFGFLLRRSFIALGAFMFYFIILENTLASYATYKKWGWGKFLPLEISDRIIPMPKFMARFNEEGYKMRMAEINEFVVYTILLTAAVWALCYYINKKRDL